MGGLIGQKTGGTYTSSFACNTTNFSKLVVVNYGFLGLKKFDQRAYARTIVGNPNVGYLPSSDTLISENEFEEEVFMRKEIETEEVDILQKAEIDEAI